MGFYLEPGSFFFGSAGDDTLSAADAGLAIGLDGDDTLRSYGGVTGLHGGQGDDVYRADAWVTQVVDAGGGNDRLRVPGHVDDYTGALIEGGHLVLVNLWTGASVVVLDQLGAGRLEHFEDQYGNHMSAQQVEQSVRSDGLGVIGYPQLAEVLAVEGVGGNQLEAAFEIETRLGQLDWAPIMSRLADAALDDAGEVAAEISAALVPQLSWSAQSLWQSMCYEQALQATRFVGLEAQVEVVNRPLAESVALLYAAALDRRPDAEGLSYWLDQAFSGMKVPEMAGYFIASQEFQQRFDVAADAAFINTLYLNVLDRPADEGGQQYWAEQMADGLPQAEVLMYFSASDENRANADWLAGLSRHDAGDWVIA
ncbi:hypothetical protein HPA02_26040 [Bisbaumannia pacifica]|uniref:DUF4214 domain-containing protein n=1 Tax=Bisbaumannia pacifica TaxID=77098 RepID=A0A510XBC9_9GAMM|nr:DUF4214 domain-containing protein [Halomonas pacifica]GEK48321.1 hypothetical protein HPA02_26040 [Halomonas pacifica]